MTFSSFEDSGLSPGLTQVHRIFTAFILIMLLIWNMGCDSNNSVEPDTEPPAIPRGVVSITGNGQVTIEWFPNGERDLAGYKIWRSRDNENFDLLAKVSSGTVRYVDRDVRNGTTYYYAISAFDGDDNESDFSPEEVSDTPRPSGNNVTLNEFALFSERSGFDFSQPERGAIAWDSPTTDVYLGLDTVVNVRYMYSDNFTEMQDMGYHESFDDVDVSPVQGFTVEFVELLPGHVYVFYTPDGNYAKIRVLSVSDNSVTFDWAYQIAPDNPELAPSLHPESQKRGPR